MDAYELAVRFTRFAGHQRLDKAAEGATTTEEIVEMYKGQLRRLLISES